MKLKLLKTSNSLDKLKRYRADFMHRHMRKEMFLTWI